MNRAPAPEALSEAPWLSAAAVEQTGRILLSHQQAFGTPLLAGAGPDRCPRQAAQELFAAAVVVLAHDGADPAADPGPRLVYANRAALRLWRRRWGEMVGMPSRFTAEPAEQAERGRVLLRAQLQHAIADYSGIRVDSAGRRFRIRGARVWSVPEAPGSPSGQAAAFEHWWWI
jgi:hypothetical protein